MRPCHRTFILPTRLLSMKSSPLEFSLASWMVVTACLLQAPFVSEPRVVMFLVSPSCTLTAMVILAYPPSPPLTRARPLVSMTTLGSTDLVPLFRPRLQSPPLLCKLQLPTALQLHSITMVVASLSKTSYYTSQHRAASNFQTTPS